jgi:hypothetical protein
MMAIIGICGLIGSGKGTAADMMVEKFGFEKVSFADSLKDCVSVVFGWHRWLLEGDTKESREFREMVDPFWSEKMGQEITPRFILQKVGTEAMRQVMHDNIWIDSLEKKLRKDRDYVIPDVRFPNEIAFVRRMHGSIIHVQRGKNPPWWDDAWIQNKFGGDLMTRKYPDIHLSEWAWVGGDIDQVVHNDGTIDELEANLRYALVSALVSRSPSLTDGA